ncbi:DUF5335 family protein [Sphingomonas japonica]|uniref:Uncharacterized protein n=1 Tax=Sphingomonas japonica TaxID=511662 RepID=A0ABX0TYL4_9SPHN|nr:DUF5335 family protein [Sphingomonas japonica]NIJ23414.1 hypothetical protein [Sphingomonas japonica]
MAIHRIDRRGWHDFFSVFTRGPVGKRAEIEVASLDLGDQIVAEWLPLLGISYDHKSDMVSIALEGVDHLIRSPREIHADYVTDSLLALHIVDGEDRHQIVRFADPIALPAPADAEQAKAGT